MTVEITERASKEITELLETIIDEIGQAQYDKIRASLSLVVYECGGDIGVFNTVADQMEDQE